MLALKFHENLLSLQTKVQNITLHTKHRGGLTTYFTFVRVLLSKIQKVTNFPLFIVKEIEEFVRFEMSRNSSQSASMNPFLFLSVFQSGNDSISTLKYVLFTLEFTAVEQCL